LFLGGEVGRLGHILPEILFAGVASLKLVSSVERANPVCMGYHTSGLQNPGPNTCPYPVSI
jgi:hypothetical protein